MIRTSSVLLVLLLNVGPALAAVVNYVNDRATWCSQVASLDGSEDFGSFITEDSFANGGSVALADEMSSSGAAPGAFGVNLIDLPGHGFAFSGNDWASDSNQATTDPRTGDTATITFADSISAFGFLQGAGTVTIEVFDGGDSLVSFSPSTSAWESHRVRSYEGRRGRGGLFERRLDRGD